MSIPPGTRLGRYEVRALLGAGGMGEVYRAYDRDLERDVAIKILRDETGDAARLRRFEQEAKATSALHHPHVAHVYEIGSDGEHHFIAMELIDGSTLRDLASRGPMSIDDVLNFGTQIAAALGAAHRMGIVHRDIKPENVIITPDGYAKVLDFGLAKLREIRRDDQSTLLHTATGVAMGTVAYMAPEQLVGSDVTPTADVFSLGVVLYEMLTGCRPFEGNSATEIASAILSKTPRPVLERRRDTPAKLAAVVTRALAKDSDDRYRDGNEVAEQLRLISRGSVVLEPTPKPRRGVVVIAAVGVAIALIGAAMWRSHQQRQLQSATAMIAAAERMMRDRRPAEAYDTAMAAAAMLPGDDRIRDIVFRTSAPLTIESDPSGATIFMQRFKGPDARVRMGTTPLVIRHMPLADYLMTLEKPGYRSATRSIALLPLYYRGEPFTHFTAETVKMKLAPATTAPEGMVLVEGGTYRLNGFDRPSERAIELHDFFIDRCEVSNRDFERFVRDGGYRRPELWKVPFVDQSKTVSFEQAMARFHDTTGLPGPRSWTGGAPPAGKESYPVTDVTWYEAAAFAEWSGKKLPTVYQWEKTARYADESVAIVLPWGFVGEGSDVNERANFRGEGTMPVDSLPFGASPYGALNMAGNVSEWCRNALPPGYTARGGAWKDAVYTFGLTAAFPAFYSSPTLGFRCVRDSGGEEGGFALDRARSIPSYTPVDERTYTEIARRYEYKPEPLNARVVERVDTPAWSREKIVYSSGGKSVNAYLYLPKGFRPPLQVIQYAPAGDVVHGYRTLPHSIEVWLTPVIRAGRAVFSVELEGSLGRPHPANWVAPDPATEEYVESNIRNVTEMRRGIDYLLTRPDIDHERIGLYGVSAGAGPGVFVAALDPRIRAVMFAGTGIARREERTAAAANRINFVSQIRQPKLLLNGRYDEDTPLETNTMPMFRLLREPKRQEVYDGPHVPPAEVLIPALTKFFDETLRPVDH